MRRSFSSVTHIEKNRSQIADESGKGRQGGREKQNVNNWIVGEVSDISCISTTFFFEKLKLYLKRNTKILR